jgi:hypothetical protein
MHRAFVDHVSPFEIRPPLRGEAIIDKMERSRRSWETAILNIFH